MSSWADGIRCPYSSKVKAMDMWPIIFETMAGGTSRVDLVGAVFVPPGKGTGYSAPNQPSPLPDAYLHAPQGSAMRGRASPTVCGPTGGWGDRGVAIRSPAYPCAATTCCPQRKEKGALGRTLRGAGGTLMQHRESEVPRILLPRTSLNKGIKEGPGGRTPDPRFDARCYITGSVVGFWSGCLCSQFLTTSNPLSK